jgi:hypothetical protein
MPRENSYNVWPNTIKVTTPIIALMIIFNYLDCPLSKEKRSDK